ncbi:MAG: hypothetical protein HGA31_02835 [Candidatus Moranbacteria bacterium]|nr:hypothetical protein [Candidatus Moranbacteria bacterium]
MRNGRFDTAAKFLGNPRTVEYFEGESIYPINVEFSISGVCQANCRKCFYRVDDNRLKGHEKRYFDMERMRILVREFAECGVKSISWTGGGEPTNHPDFDEITRIVKAAGLIQDLFTNALSEIWYDPSLME